MSKTKHTQTRWDRKPQLHQHKRAIDSAIDQLETARLRISNRDKRGEQS